MSSPNGATHDLEERIWKRPLPTIHDDRTYDMILCDGVTGGVKLKLFKISGAEVKATIDRWSELKWKPFVYEVKDKRK